MLRRSRRYLRQSPDHDEGEHPRAYSVHGTHLLGRCHGLGHATKPSAASPNHFPLHLSAHWSTIGVCRICRLAAWLSARAATLDRHLEGWIDRWSRRSAQFLGVIILMLSSVLVSTLDAANVQRGNDPVAVLVLVLARVPEQVHDTGHAGV